MSTSIAEHLRRAGRTVDERTSKAEAISTRRKGIRPLPATREEADALFAPKSRIASQPATLPRISRMLKLGLMPCPTNAEAHAAILDAMYDEQGNLRLAV